MIQTLLMDFDWTTALVRFSINTIFIASMIFIISRQTVLKRFSFTFMMISLIVFFLCYTLKNFDLNLGMALGLFAIFGIIRYRTLPLQTEEMTYLFVTIGVAVINALSEDFLTVNELIIINITIILFILFGEIILKKLSYGNLSHPLDEDINRRVIIQLEYNSNIKDSINKEITSYEKNLDIKIKSFKIFKIDKKLNISISSLTNSNNKYQNLISDYLSSLGFNEIMNNSLVGEKSSQNDNKVILLNSLSSDISAMRTSLLPGMLKSLSHNINRKNTDLKFYEFGSTYKKLNDVYKESKKLGIILSGEIIQSSWYSKNNKSDLFILKNIILNILEKFGINYKEIHENNKIVISYSKNNARIEKVDKSLLSKFEINDYEVFYASIDINNIYESKTDEFFKVKKLSKYPQVRRDFSFIIDNKILFNDLMNAIKQTSKLIKEIKLMDVYDGKPLKSNEKSYSFSVVLEDINKTLEDSEINKISEKIIKETSKKFNAVLRS